MLLLNRSQSNARTTYHQRQRAAWIGITSAFCLTAGGLLGNAIAPGVVQATPLRANVMLDVQAGETYDVFMQRATAAAKAATQGAFNRNSLISDLSVVVTGQNQGSMVQVLTLRANRNQWRSNPNAGRWATFYPTAQSLLGLAVPAPVPASTAVGTAQPATTQQPGNNQRPGTNQPLIPGQPIILVPVVPGQPVQVIPVPGGTNVSPTPRVLTPGTPGAIAPNQAVTTPQSVNGTNRNPATTSPTTPSSPTTVPQTLEQQFYPDLFPSQPIQSPSTIQSPSQTTPSSR